VTALSLRRFCEGYLTLGKQVLDGVASGKARMNPLQWAPVEGSINPLDSNRETTK
jgi:hypothetical protein